MIAYLDSSVLMRVLLGQPHALPEFVKIERPVASKLLKVECLRTLDRARVRGLLNEMEFVKAAQEFHDSIDAIEWIELVDLVLERACASLAIPLGTLDSIHLCSAMLWREQSKQDLYFLTHDETLGRAARSLGFHVLGCVET